MDGDFARNLIARILQTSKKSDEVPVAILTDCDRRGQVVPMACGGNDNTTLTSGATGTLGVTGASTGGARTEQCKHKVRCVHESLCELRNWGGGCAIDFASSEDAVARCTDYVTGYCCCAMHGCYSDGSTVNV